MFLAFHRFPPPSGPFPGPFGNANFGTNVPADCNIQDNILEAVLALNPCFNFDHIFDTCPVLYNPLGVGIFMADFNPPGPEVYYNRPAVKKAIHAPDNVTWALSSSEDVFAGKKKVWEVHYHDVSLPPAQIGIVSKMIEATNNVIVGAGGLDFQLPANGTLFVFQNMVSLTSHNNSETVIDNKFRRPGTASKASPHTQTKRSMCRNIPSARTTRCLATEIWACGLRSED
jgi:hypothetical protein